MDEQIQYLSLLTDYTDRAFEIEVETDVNAQNQRRGQVHEECTVIDQRHQEEMKLLEQNKSVTRSSYISDARKQLMNETKNVFAQLQQKGTEKILNHLKQNKQFYQTLIDDLILETSKQFDTIAVVSVNPNDRSYVQQNLEKYNKQSNLTFQLGKNLGDDELGVKIYNEKLNICVDSTINQRIKQSMKIMAPKLNAIVLPDVPLIE